MCSRAAQLIEITIFTSQGGAILKKKEFVLMYHFNSNIIALQSCPRLHITSNRLKNICLCLVQIPAKSHHNNCSMFFNENDNNEVNDHSL